eukprot:CAMPEP_0196662562 /NCGR_PEP_ID=MMETSP1086-20130531/49258_1 /TAXON_ID=77921 /ORGANISM="Cyanoptyche  gloeocystis , Strain SAG4.97" /LENGTH=68 /DNA_ID=CAMNT_0041998013 /DNA_START=184 /DNA_END=390 /DNA_ORIENTATION=+
MSDEEIARAAEERAEATGKDPSRVVAGMKASRTRAETVGTAVPGVSKETGEFGGSQKRDQAEKEGSKE